MVGLEFVNSCKFNYMFCLFAEFGFLNPMKFIFGSLWMVSTFIFCLFLNVMIFVFQNLFICRHIDGHHKLIKYGMVTHAAVDGFSRVITFIHCSNNNRQSTVLRLFKRATKEFKHPLRIRTDKGGENVAVARYMCLVRGVDANPVLTGKSTHNQRIERYN